MGYIEGMDALVETPSFELSGGSLCLDFANTWPDRGREESDQLQSLAHLTAFARQAGLVDEAWEEILVRRVREDPASARAALARAREAREAIFRLCSDSAAGRPARPGDLRIFNRALGEALGHLRLEPAEGGFRWGWEGTSPDAPLWPILRSAADLLASEDRGRIRECAGSQCTWLFLDRSRAGTRRWCSMSSCGNRAKARRHYHRKAV